MKSPTRHSRLLRSCCVLALAASISFLFDFCLIQSSMIISLSSIVIVVIVLAKRKPITAFRFRFANHLHNMSDIFCPYPSLESIINLMQIGDESLHDLNLSFTGSFFCLSFFSFLKSTKSNQKVRCDVWLLAPSVREFGVIS